MGKHWYNDIGEPVYSVENVTKGGLRPTTLRDAKKLNLVPSVTTVMDVLRKPALEIWKENQVLESALSLKQKKKETDKGFINRIRYHAKEISRTSAQEGKNIHKSVEKSFLNILPDEKYSWLAHSTKRKIQKYFNRYSGWKAETTFYNKLGFGGRTDITNDRLVIDLKTKEKFKYTKTGKIVKMAYDEHVMQLIAYAHGVDMPDARLVNVFVEYSGELVFHEWDQEDIERGWEMFLSSLKMWQLKNKVS